MIQENGEEWFLIYSRDAINRVSADSGKIARSLLRTLANFKTPCSVKTMGKYLVPPLPFLEVTNCDLKAVYSSLVNSNRKSTGNLLLLRLTASFNRFVSTPDHLFKAHRATPCSPVCWHANS